MHRSMGHVFSRWLEVVEMMAIERAQGEHETSLALLRSEMETQRAALQKSLVAQCVARWNGTKMSKSFTQWVWWVSQRRRVSAMLLRVSHSCLYAAMAGWHGSAQQSKQQRVIVGRVVTRIRCNILLRAFGGW